VDIPLSFKVVGVEDSLEFRDRVDLDSDLHAKLLEDRKVTHASVLKIIIFQSSKKVFLLRLIAADPLLKFVP
jgi:hypothetical protein